MTLDTAAQVAVSALIQQQVAEGRQIGVQVCVTQHGRVVVDAVAGTLGPDDHRPVQPDSLFCSFSTTKGVAALAVHQAHDRGLLDLDAPVAKYWPAFGQHGKDKITVAQAMSHMAGLHAMPDPFTPEHITDWDAGIERMEAGVPAYEPATATGYHAATFGWIAGGIMAGATGLHIKDWIRTEIAEPLGVGDSLYVGIPDTASVRERLATLEHVAPGDGLPIPDDHDFFKAMPRVMFGHFNEMPFRTACLPSGNGHFTARALARMYGALAGGGSIDGVRIISEGAIARMSRVVTDDVDRVLLSPLRKCSGFFAGGDVAAVPSLFGPRTSAFGHPGAGGSVGFADPEVGMGVGVTLNKMQYPNPGEGVTLDICDLIRRELAP